MENGDCFIRETQNKAITFKEVYRMLFLAFHKLLILLFCSYSWNHECNNHVQ